MEFPFISPSSASSSSCSDGYFTAQALRAGMISLRGNFGKSELLPPLPSFSTMEREMMKERIREEIIMREMMERRIFEEELRRDMIQEEMIAREMEERRILEEEVRRELELERAMGVRRFGKGIFPETMVNCAIQGLPEVRYGRGFGPQMKWFQEAGFHHRFTLPGKDEVKGGKNSTFFHNLLEEKIIEPSPENKSNSSKLKLSGTKRKAGAVGGARGPVAPAQAWGCALCQVTATSKEGLDDHLQGKKHMVKAAQLAGSKTGLVRNSCTEADPTNGLKKVSSNANKKQQERKSFCCELCKVECNSTSTLAAHLRGKKHISRIELQKKCDTQVGPKQENNEVGPKQKTIEAHQNVSKFTLDTTTSVAKGALDTTASVAEEVMQENEGLKIEK